MDESELRAAAAGLPAPLPAGPDLVLRPLTLDDGEALHSWRRVPEVARYTSRPPLTRGQVEEFLASRLADPTALFWGIERAGRLVGDVGGRLTPAAHLAGPTGWWECSLAYTLHPDAWGAGVATAAAVAMRDLVFAHLPVRRMTAMVFAENAASARVVTKAGFRLEATHVAAVAGWDGRWWDDQAFALLRDEWDALR